MICTFNPRSPLTWLVATWMETAEVNAEMTGAEMKPSKRPEFMKNVENSNVLMGQTPN